MTVTDATSTTPGDDATGDDTALDAVGMDKETVANDAVAGETVLPETDDPVEEPDDDAVMAADAEPTADVLGVDGEAEPVLAENDLAGQDIDLDDTPPS
ncbi:hypothetical protein BFL37_07365 [Clavibacter michiganensis]|uniref:Uncharacterized protein n=1 Tax=Clavibacter michiganensis TaxID=28447 RepID=A0A251YME6_9MICO|nr:hypothetical protein BFL37_07365 [Clavibacter michiganensis]